MEEIWKSIKNYEGYYQVSNLGNIRRILFVNNQTTFPKITILKSKKMNSGYLKVGLSVDGIHKYYLVHRLVAQAFIPNPNNLPQVNHIDGNKLNNHVDNLEWVSSYENQQHAVKNGLRPLKKINQYDLTNHFIKTWSSLMEASRSLKINKATISFCCQGKRKTAGGFIWKYFEKGEIK